MGSKVSAFEGPPAQAVNHAHIGIWIGGLTRGEVNIKFNRSALQRCYEPGIAVWQHAEENRVDRVHTYKRAPDFNHESDLANVGG